MGFKGVTARCIHKGEVANFIGCKFFSVDNLAFYNFFWGGANCLMLSKMNICIL